MVAWPKLNIAFFVRANGRVWLNAHYTVAAHIKFACICIILAILCWVTKFTRQDSLRIFPARCCTHGSWVFVTHAPANGRVLKLRCQMISGKRSQQQDCKTEGVRALTALRGWLLASHLL